MEKNYKKAQNSLKSFYDELDPKIFLFYRRINFSNISYSIKLIMHAHKISTENVLVEIHNNRKR